jgi:hypothetical protein
MLTTAMVTSEPPMKQFASRQRKATGEVWFSDASLRDIDRDVERYIERWLRHVILVDDDGMPRRMTEEEIQDGMMSTRAEGRRERANYRRRRKRARERARRNAQKELRAAGARHAARPAKRR